MRSRTSRLFVLITCLILASTMFGQPGVENPDPDGGGGSSGSCGPGTCSLDRCGCASAPLGYRLTFSCACGTHSCTRSCVYEPL